MAAELEDVGRVVGLERTVSQTTKALLAVRELILAGALAPGSRISELSVVDLIGVSRTPVRAALARLEGEGFLQPIPGGGYQVRAFSVGDIFDAIEIRGTLEGLAARFAAERGPAEADLAAVRRPLARLDAIISAQADLSSEADFSAYIALNAAFHDALKTLAGSPTLARQVDRANAHPFASHSAFVALQGTLPEARMILTIAQDQHRSVVEAIERREGARAEAIMREHARLASRNLRAALTNRTILDLVPGAALIRSFGT